MYRQTEEFLIKTLHGCEYHAEWDVLFPLACSAFLCLVICEFLLQSMKYVGYFARFNYVPESLYRLNFP